MSLGYTRFASRGTSMRGGPSAGCLVEQAVKAGCNQSFHDAEALLPSRFGEVMRFMLSADVHDRLVARAGPHDLEHVHAI